MNNLNKESKNKPPIYMMAACAIITIFVNQAFLSGKIIDIPYGTREGGIIAGIGVAVIIIVLVIITVGMKFLINKYGKKSPKK